VPPDWRCWSIPARIDDLVGLALALATAVTWAAGTVYLKWARIDADPIAIAAWQVLVALVITVGCLLVFEGSPHWWPVHPRSLWALIFAGMIGSAFAYLLWFEIVRRLPATTASLGVLSAPAVGSSPPCWCWENGRASTIYRLRADPGRRRLRAARAHHPFTRSRADRAMISASPVPGGPSWRGSI
jgi:hypothetical protein